MGKIMKTRKAKSSRNARHPLSRQMAESDLKSQGLLSTKCLQEEAGEDAAEEVEQRLSAQMTEKIFKTAQQQKNEIEEGESEVPVALNMSSATATPNLTADFEDVAYDAELPEHEEEYEDVELSAEDERMLSMFMPVAQPQGRCLADIIMDKIREKESGAVDPEQVLRNEIPEKVFAVYKQVGVILNRFKSGKLPKAIKVVPSLRNWEEIMYLTTPDKWSAQSLSVITRLFAANFNSRMAQRFYNLVLLPRIRDNISQYKRLNFHLYMAVRKAIFKPAAFFKGVLLPLAEDGCTAREAVILGSILNKISIPMMHSGAALLKLTELPYSGPTLIFVKTLLNKKYSLPYQVIEALVKYFVRFKNDERQMPVIWHQTLLVFAQRYKNVINDDHKEKLKVLLRTQNHRAITDEIRRELFAPPLVTDQAMAMN